LDTSAADFMQVAERFPNISTNLVEISPSILYLLAIGCGLHTIEE